MALDRQRGAIETEQDLQAQTHTVASLKASIAQSEKRIAQIDSNYRQQLQNERMDAERSNSSSAGARQAETPPRCSNSERRRPAW